MSKTLVECQVGFHFTINGAPTEQELLSAEFALYADAHARFARLVSVLPCWSERSTHPDDDFDINPYQVCESEAELDDNQGLALFPLWVSSYRELPAEHVEQLRSAAKQAFQEAAQALHGTAQYALTRVYREWRLTEWETLPA